MHTSKIRSYTSPSGASDHLYDEGLQYALYASEFTAPAPPTGGGLASSDQQLQYCVQGLGSVDQWQRSPQRHARKSPAYTTVRSCPRPQQ